LRHQQEQLQSTKWELEALLSDRRVELADLEMVTECVDDLRSLLEESTLAERKSFIRSFVKEVKVTGDEVLLTYTMPLPPEGISQERVGVLHSVRYGGDRGIRTPDLCHDMTVVLHSCPPIFCICTYYTTPFLPGLRYLFF